LASVMTNGSVAMLPELFVALIEREYVRRVPFGIVPEMVAVHCVIDELSTAWAKFLFP